MLSLFPAEPWLLRQVLGVKDYDVVEARGLIGQHLVLTRRVDEERVSVAGRLGHPVRDLVDRRLDRSGHINYPAEVGCLLRVARVCVNLQVLLEADPLLAATRAVICRTE